MPPTMNPSFSEISRPRMDAGETSAAATTKPSVASWDTPAALVKRDYFMMGKM